MTTTWTIAIDWDRNDDYIGTYDDVSTRVISAKWFLGARTPYQQIANDSVFDLELDNSDKRYSPDNSFSPLYGKLLPQRPVRIQSNDGTTVRTHWTGWLEAITPAVGKYGKRTVKITATGSMQFFKAAETRLPVQENKRADEIIRDLVDEVLYPYTAGQTWVLGKVGNSELTSSTYLAAPAFAYLEAGALRFGQAGDNWVRQSVTPDAPHDSFDVYHAISDIVAAERGRFFFDREGRAIFWNRHHLLLGTAPLAATFTDTMTDLAYTYAGLDYLHNEVSVVCHPRSTSAVTTDLLWSLQDAVIPVDAGGTRTLSINYDDGSGRRIGAKDVTVTNVTCEDGSVSASISANASGAKLTFTNTSNNEAIIVTCEVRGRKIVDNGEMEATAVDTASVNGYGRRTLRINLPSVDKLTEAQTIAGHELWVRSQPRGIAQSLTVQSHGLNGGGQHNAQLGLSLGNRIRVTETQSGHDADYFVMGEAHELSNGATLWKTTWYLEPRKPVYTAPTGYPWMLGVEGRSNLTSSTVVTY
jgi:hypothetical protein